MYFYRSYVGLLVKSATTVHAMTASQIQDISAWRCCTNNLSTTLLACLADGKISSKTRRRSGVRRVDRLQVFDGGHRQLPHLEGEQLVDAALGRNKGEQAAAAIEIEVELEWSDVKMECVQASSYSAGCQSAQVQQFV